MEVKAGYKKTEVGVIPEDWDAVSLSEALTCYRLGGNYRNQLADNGRPLIKMGNIGRGSVDVKTLEYIPTSSALDEEDRLRLGDVLFNTRNTLELVGKVAAWRDELPVAYYNSNLLKFDFNARVGSSFFASYLLNSDPLIKALAALATGTTSVAAIYTRDLLQLVIPLPPLSEQRAIAEALSDADAHITALEALIAKKRAVKQGAMQELLTGKRRLPGFTSEWRTVKLGEVVDIVMGQSPSSNYYNVEGRGLPLIQGNADILDRKTIKKTFTSESPKKAFSGDILMSVRAPVGEISRTAFDICLGRGVCSLRGANSYLYHSLIYNEMNWKKFSKGSTFASVNFLDVSRFEICIPLKVDEQSSIAAVLSDMDDEIEAFEAKHGKAMQIKAAMMQELLTGRIRLV